MNTYIGLYIMITFGVIGFVCGSLFMIYALRTVPKRKKKLRQHKPVTIVEEETILEEPPRKPKEKGLLKKRLKKEDNSWTEFNCTCDETNVSEVIKEKQKKEDKAYHYIKRKSEKE